jgi:hypothetical protein
MLQTSTVAILDEVIIGKKESFWTTRNITRRVVVVGATCVVSPGIGIVMTPAACILSKGVYGEKRLFLDNPIIKYAESFGAILRTDNPKVYSITNVFGAAPIYVKNPFSNVTLISDEAIKFAPLISNALLGKLSQTNVPPVNRNGMSMLLLMNKYVGLSLFGLPVACIVVHVMAPVAATDAPAIAPVAVTVVAVTAPVAATVAPVTVPAVVKAAPVITPVDVTVAPVTAPVAATVAPVTVPVEVTVAPVTAPVAATVAPVTVPVEVTVAPVTAPVDATVVAVTAPVAATVVAVTAPVAATVVAVTVPVAATVVAVTAPVADTLPQLTGPVTVVLKNVGLLNCVKDWPNIEIEDEYVSAPVTGSYVATDKGVPCGGSATGGSVIPPGALAPMLLTTITSVLRYLVFMRPMLMVLICAFPPGADIP